MRTRSRSLSVALDVPFGGGRWIGVAPPGAATTIALVLVRDGDPGTRLELGCRPCSVPRSGREPVQGRRTRV